jgi:hypothetical protein
MVVSRLGDGIQFGGTGVVRTLAASERLPSIRAGTVKTRNRRLFHRSVVLSSLLRITTLTPPMPLNLIVLPKDNLLKGNRSCPLPADAVATHSAASDG